MILIYSREIEDSTSCVIDWLNYKGEKHIRINNGNIDEFILNIHLSNQKFNISLNGFDKNSIKSIWYRRTGPSVKPELPPTIDESLKNSFEEHLGLELGAVRTSFYQNFKNTKWLSHPYNCHVDKIHVFGIASQVGLQIPPTLITNKKQDVLDFIKEHKSIVVKNIAYTLPFFIDGRVYSTYTAKISNKTIKKYSDKFFPSAFQKLIEKEYEVRAFYIDAKIYSMAIFSQQNKITKLDFRRYTKTPNRTVPYKLPSDICKKIRLLMDELSLNTGSIDLIKTKEGFVFLEVNPVGQFGMVSQPCNYYLEKEVANFLSNEK